MLTRIQSGGLRLRFCKGEPSIHPSIHTPIYAQQTAMLRRRINQTVAVVVVVQENNKPWTGLMLHWQFWERKGYTVRYRHTRAVKLQGSRLDRGFGRWAQVTVYSTPDRLHARLFNQIFPAAKRDFCLFGLALNFSPVLSCTAPGNALRMHIILLLIPQFKWNCHNDVIDFAIHNRCGTKSGTGSPGIGL